MKILKRLRTNEDGAVTVDWVVLTAAVIGLGAAVLSSVSSGVMNLTTQTDMTANTLDSTTINTLIGSE